MENSCSLGKYSRMGKEAFPPHKSPTRPLLLVLVFGEEYKYSYVLFAQLPFKTGIFVLSE